ncbi:hypothetical protein NDU88_004629 [Pleurodeles waltl]|uniref:Uncharacterized protein n=1 Tax=Pleurodeles waltl TaxID=8319 RepID=A0AAV7WVM8_PLEWA|nr:hypothetical protein NDU88_004629 [Pleurodeles waltl]
MSALLVTPLPLLSRDVGLTFSSTLFIVTPSDQKDSQVLLLGFHGTNAWWALDCYPLRALGRLLMVTALLDQLEGRAVTNLQEAHGEHSCCPRGCVPLFDAALLSPALFPSPRMAGEKEYGVDCQQCFVKCGRSAHSLVPLGPKRASTSEVGTSSDTALLSTGFTAETRPAVWAQAEEPATVPRRK